MNDRKIVLADYISWTDSAGEPTGHGFKVLKEYALWIQDSFEITFAAHETYLRKVSDEYNKIKLSYHIHEGVSYSSLIGKIKQLWISWHNVKKVFAIKDSKYIWFTNIDIFLFFYLYCHKEQRKKVVITMYLNEFSSLYQKAIAQRVLKDIKLLIYSNRDNSYSGKNRIYIPDYLYDEKKYKKYASVRKKKEVVCVGNMGPQKELDALVDAFVSNGFPLRIVGKFSDYEQYERLKKAASSNIIIENRYLGYEEYLKLIGEAQYSILPYRKEAYFDKTSGVILESIFLDTVPIAAIELLEKWNVLGISYNSLNELRIVKLDDFDCNIYVWGNRELIQNTYLFSIYLTKLKDLLKG